MEDFESGYIEKAEAECYVGSEMRDVEVIKETSTYIIATGRRYGRKWLLKGLREEFRGSAAMKRRLIKEFEINSRLRHPNIVQAVGFEDIEGLGQCIVQEWIDGTTLHEALRDGSLTEADRCRIVRELTEAASYLHRSGVVHRDIKPSNVMIRKTGRETVLIDFGLADSDDYVEAKGAGGTQGFISPEQAEKGGVDPADDVYSLGVLMREMTPRYRWIAKRSTGALKSRPKDAGELLKRLDSRDRMPKIALVVVAGLIVAVGGIMMGLRIFKLEHSSDGSQRDVTALVEKNAKNEALVKNLKDSLESVHGKLSSTRDELIGVQGTLATTQDELVGVQGTLATTQNKLTGVQGSVSSAKGEIDKKRAYEAERKRIYTEGCRKIEEFVKNYDKKFANLTPKDELQYSIESTYIGQETVELINNYISSVGNTSLSHEDLEKINGDLQIFAGQMLLNYLKKWKKKVCPDFVW